MALGAIMYSADNDDRFPPAKWMDADYPYSRNHLMEHCPNFSSTGTAYGYSMRRDLVGVTTTTIPAPETSPLIFDSTDLKRNSVEDLSFLPTPGRHDGKNSIVYADTHAKGVPSP